jgi:hypothetical protein
MSEYVEQDVLLHPERGQNAIDVRFVWYSLLSRPLLFSRHDRKSRRVSTVEDALYLLLVRKVQPVRVRSGWNGSFACKDADRSLPRFKNG